jgi:acetyltransferase-like isoleucine patch superfamily enzyme
MPSIFRPFLIKQFWRRITIARASWQFRRQCAQIGQGLQVLGPCLVHGAGVIEAGDNLVIRSRHSNQTEIFAGKGARLKIGSDVFINQGVRIVCSTDVRIGDAE